MSIRQLTRRISTSTSSDEHEKKIDRRREVCDFQQFYIKKITSVYFIEH